jgi:hypothetical protein
MKFLIMYLSPASYCFFAVITATDVNTCVTFARHEMALPAETRRVLIPVSSVFTSQYIFPCPLSSFLFKIPVPCSHTLCDISLSQHAVRFPSRSPNIDYLKKQSKRLQNGAPEVLALRIQRTLQLLRVSLESVRKVWGQTQFIPFYSLFIISTTYHEACLQKIQHVSLNFH